MSYKLKRPFAEIVNVESAEEDAAFEDQVRKYATELIRNIAARKETETEDARLLAKIVSEASVRYRVRCQLVELQSCGARGRRFYVSHAAATIVVAANVLLLLLDKNRESSQSALLEHKGVLERRHADYPKLIIVVHCPPGIESMPLDRLTYLRMARTNPALSWNVAACCEKPAKAAPRTRKRGGGILLTRSQRAVADKIKQFHKLRGKRVAGYAIRPPLVVGPSGAGKTAVARVVADELRLPIVDANAGTWQLQGSKAEVSTADQIRNAVRENGRGFILFLDEIEKFSGRDHTWWLSVNQEVFALIDRRLTSFSTWDDEDRKRFTDSCFIFGAGTWQHLFRRQSRSLGFTSASVIAQPASSAFEDDTIPEELLFRFHPTLLFVDPPSSDEFQERISAIRRGLDFSPLTSDQIDSLVQQAIESRRGNRWLEAYAAELAIAQQKEPSIVSDK